MATVDNEESSINMRGLTNFLSVLQQRFAVRLVLLLGIIVFVTAVSIDSFQHQAVAADIRTSTSELSTFPLSQKFSPDGLTTVSSGSDRKHSGAADTYPFTEETYLDFDAKTAERLGHSDMLGASLTRSRLTHAHLFTR